MNRSRADSMGMLATVINALGVCEVLEQMGVSCYVETSVEMLRVAEVFTREKADGAFGKRQRGYFWRRYR